METIFHLYGDHAAELMIRRPAERANKPQAALNAVGEKMLRDERLLFQTSGFSSRRPWRPLAKSTIERKRREHMPEPTRPLFGFGTMMRSLSEKGAPHNLFRVTRTFVLIGSTAPGVAETQTGGPGKHQPERAAIDFSREQVRSYEQIMSDFIFYGHA